VTPEQEKDCLEQLGVHGLGRVKADIALASQGKALLRAHDRIVELMREVRELEDYIDRHMPREDADAA
jgi:hypothetical protein